MVLGGVSTFGSGKKILGRGYWHQCVFLATHGVSKHGKDVENQFSALVDQELLWKNFKTHPAHP